MNLSNNDPQVLADLSNMYREFVTRAMITAKLTSDPQDYVAQTNFREDGLPSALLVREFDSVGRRRCRRLSPTFPTSLACHF